MKILHLLFSQQVAGAEKYLLDLLPALKEKGVDCSLICVVPEADKHKFIGFCSELNSKGVETRLHVSGASGFLSAAKYIAGHMKQNNIRYLHSHLFKADILAVLTKKIFHRKAVILSTKHGYHEKYFNNYQAHKGKIVYDLYYFISRVISANIDEQVTTSRAMSELFYSLKLSKKPMPYIHHGINIEVPAPSKACRLAEQQLIIVGRIEQIKGHTYLLKAMPAVIEKYPAVKLLILGNGTEKEKLQKEAAALNIDNNIEFLGFQQNPYVYIAQSDMLILPSFYESFGLVFIEAFALKTPAIGFDVPAGNEIITNNETGLLVPLFDVAELSGRIIYLLDNKAERERIAHNAFVKYTNYYTTGRMVQDTISWYQSIISV